MYPTLYKSRQAEPKYLPRSWYYNDALRLPWVRTIAIKKTAALDKERVRGLIYASNKETHGGLESLDYTIIIADGMTPEYERFVTIKELMHCYFAPNNEKNVRYLTGTQIALENHMNAFFGGATSKPPQDEAEKMALWMAIGVLTPEHDRTALIARIKAKTTSVEQEGVTLKVPAKQVKAMISNFYQAEISKLISC